MSRRAVQSWSLVLMAREPRMAPAMSPAMITPAVIRVAVVVSSCGKAVAMMAMTALTIVATIMGRTAA